MTDATGKRSPDRTRLDRLLVQLGLARSRSRARELVRAGHVARDGTVLRKPGTVVEPTARISVTGADHPWVSRGGIKLAAALDDFRLSPEGMICLDVGASTGGFSHVLRDRGARRIIAVDVGHGQFAGELAADPAIVLLERTDARSLTADLVTSPIDLLVADVSFIPVRTALGPALGLVRPGGTAVILVKPQFELGPDRVGKGGLVRVEEWRTEACRLVEAWVAARPGWHILGIKPSIIAGGDGNREYFLAARRSGQGAGCHGRDVSE